MSYISQGIVCIVIGVFLLIVPPIGIVTIILSALMLSKGSKDIVPGSQPGWCTWNGHDWRNDLPGIPPGKTCRNCLKRKDGRSLVAYSPTGPWTVGMPGWAPAPGYGGSPVVMPPAPYGQATGYAQPVSYGQPVPYAQPAPYTQPASPAQPALVFCASCGLQTDAAQPLCRHCGRPSR